MKNVQELNQLKQAALEEMDSKKWKILICGGTGCTSSGSIKLLNKLEEELEAAGIREDVNIIKTGCFGLCALGPIMIVYPDGYFYSRLEPEQLHEIVQEHLAGGRPVLKYLYEETVDGETISAYDETVFYKHQNRTALRNCGVIAPDNIDHYIAQDGYQALAKVLLEMTPDDVIKELEESGLRGRGGGGFPTFRKWLFTKNAEGDKKYICCNADEGDPGAFMDRSILEGDPHSVIEAMIIAGYTVGADEGYIYVRAEYPIAVDHLQIAIRQARERGLLGENILGSGFSFDLDLRLGAGAFVCGEETALMRSIEGERGEPRPRPPFPAVKGLFAKPTMENNVETFANIPQIILKGAKWFSSMGTDNAKGTKVFALGGKINHTGLVEVPMGTPLRQVIEEIGGGIPNGKKFKAAQTGGPSGGCIPASLMDIPIDYNSLIEIGSMMGSGGLIVMDEDTCMVDMAKFFLEFTIAESCGKCTPCRIGTKRLYEILDKITSGNGELEDLDRMEELANHIKEISLCGLGQTAPNPVLSTLRYFRDEYVAHIVDKKCPAGVCKALLQYKIDETLCKGCTLCARGCPAGAISGSVKQPHKIDPKKCIKCGACLEKCRFGAISRG